jgi:two-component system nitrogen regulation response regulator GlnG
MPRATDRKHVLIVDDEEAVCWALRRALAQEGHSTAVAASAEEAFDLAARQHPDAVILDVHLPGLDGLTALGRLGAITGGAPVVVITAFGNLTTAVRAVEGGAFEYLTKPFDLGQALDAVARALERPGPGGPAAGPPGAAVEPDEIVGRSPAMQTVFRRIALVAPRDASVLITGESGTGKELVARAVHRHSPRADRPFLPVHLAALSPGLVESELFGHVKGAFTGAEQHRPGLLALADGGTVFLDELGDVPLPVQVKLLRVLEHGEVFPVGGSRPQRLDVRVLAATHQDLARRVAEGAFRHDLFFRLNVFQVHLPPLRERPGDIPLLVRHFLHRLGAGGVAVPAETLRHLEAQPWPGNVRELRNALEHAVIVAPGGPLRPEHFPAPRPTGGGADPLADAVHRWLADRLAAKGSGPPAGLYQELLAAMESALLGDVLGRVGGNRWQAARWLGLSRATVRKKLEEYRLGEPDRTDNGQE